MARTKGSIKHTHYNYKVVEQKTDIHKETYRHFTTQKQMQDYYGLPRTAVYYMISRPQNRKRDDKIIITKLDEPLPIYNTTCTTIDY